jgi:hypothetical protein
MANVGGSIAEIEGLKADVKQWQQLCINANAEVERQRGKVDKLVCLLAERDIEIGKLEAVLAALLEDTQHSEHICPDDDCPVRLARAALKEDSDEYST